MSASTSSADPALLDCYYQIMTPRDQDLVGASFPLGNTLASFEASCREYPVHVSHLAGIMRGEAARAGENDVWVRQVAEKFLWADSSVAVAAAPTLTVDNAFDALQWLDDMRGNVQAVIGPLLVATSLRVGANPNVIIIKLPHWLKQFGFDLREVRTWAGLKGHLNIISVGNLPGHIARVGVITSIPIIAWKWIEDFHRYEGDRRTAAMGVDAALVLAPVGLGYLAGLAIVAAGAVVSAPAVVVGGAIILATVAIGFGVNWLVDKYGLRDKAIDFVEGAIEDARSAFDRGAAWVDENIFQPVSKAVAGAWNSAMGWVDAAGRELVAAFQNTNTLLFAGAAAATGITAAMVPALGVVTPLGVLLAGNGQISGGFRGAIDQIRDWLAGLFGPAPTAPAPMPGPAPIPVTPPLPTPAPAPSPTVPKTDGADIGGTGSTPPPDVVVGKLTVAQMELTVVKDPNNPDGTGDNKVGTIPPTANVMVKETKVIDGKTWWLVSGVGFTGGIKRTAVEGWVCAESKDGKSQLGKTKDLPGTKIPSGGYLHFPVTRANNTKNQLTQLWGQNDVVDYTKYQEPDADGNLVTKYTGMAGHNGIDIDADLDDPILPVDSGVIVKAEYNKWLGNHIVVKHSWGTTTYAHLNTIDKSILDRIKAGDKDIRVDPNMTMGGAGTTGNSTGVHLHLQITIDGQKTGYSWRETIDPLAYLDTKDYDTRPELKPPPPPSGTDVNPAKPK